MIIAASLGSSCLPLACSANSSQPPRVEHRRVSGDEGSGQENDPHRTEQRRHGKDPGHPVLAASHRHAMEPRGQQDQREQADLLAQGPTVPGLCEVR
jgi:hypothetical protein